MNIPMEAYLLLAAVMFCAGIYGFITRRNTLTMLMSLELILNAVDLNFVVFNRFLYPGAFEGMFFTFFAIAVAAGETAIIIAIIINIYRNMNSVQIDSLDEMKH
jgi:NADH-quinone oxidoreductase subunit K